MKSDKQSLNPKIRFKQGGYSSYPDWKVTTIGQSGSFSYGKSAPKWSISTDAATPCVRYGELYTTHRYVVKEITSFTNIDPRLLRYSVGGEVLVPRVGEDPQDFCKCAYLPFPNIAIGEMISIYRTSQNGLFISYLFNSRMKKEFAKRVEGGNVSNLYYPYLEDIKMRIPCLEEQQKIASFFSTLDQKIELNERKLEALEKLKKGVMQKIFDQEFSFKNKEGKEFPEWEKAYLKDILLFQNGINTGKENFGTGIKLISVNEVLSPFPIKYDDISSSVMVDDNLGKKFSVTYGDVLFQRSSETREDAGTSNVYIDNTREAVFGGFVIRGKRIGDYNPIFLHELLRSSKVRQQIIKYAQGAQHINIGQESLEKIEIKLPCREEQEKIAELAIALYKKIELLTNKLKGLKNLKKGFMQQMFV